MANKIQIKRGLRNKLPTLSIAEMGLCTDTNELFVGNGSNLQVMSIKQIINNLNDGGVNKMLSAEQGKILKNNIVNNELNINFFDGNTKEQKLINMIKFASANGHKKVYVPSGIYNFATISSDTIELGEEFKKIQIIGENPKDTIFQYGHLSNKPFIKVKGGSGSLSMGTIENIRFEGNDTTKAIQLADVCGFKVKNCSFGRNLIGVNFYNENGFTEFCEVVDSDFDSLCITSIEYTVRPVTGHASFHGSGLKGCTINQNNSTLRNNIVIGEKALLYNSPLDLTIWNTSSVPLINHNGDPLSNAYGNIRIETFGSNKHELVTGKTLYYVGGYETWGGHTSFNNVMFMENVDVRNGGISGFTKLNRRGKNLNVGDNLLMECNSDYQMQVTIIGAFYRYCGNFIIGKNPQSDELTISKLGEHSLFDQLGKGHVSLKGKGNGLYVNVPNQIDSLNITYTFRNLN